MLVILYQQREHQVGAGQYKWQRQCIDNLFFGQLHHLCLCWVNQINLPDKQGPHSPTVNVRSSLIADSIASLG
ncbi:TPA: hypothetical protein SMQ69_000236 [Proteus mirabilis]|uniref:hypothetical protein n=1 Tax=Morganellaceae TaxID=1903414 RepID=UPI001B36904F|nr:MULTISPECIES: hypothetical protein [Morganellaceae]MBQ0208414.1 hypothetical protein [Providencia rettgeri]MDF7438226.1 hypothetical protein [Proteus mirabilis]HEK1168065.1 hypothetical protein [Proteus mirabilis]